jgi:hypothetical protein
MIFFCVQMCINVGCYQKIRIVMIFKKVVLKMAIVKPGLTTYSMFETIQHVFDRNANMVVSGATN